MIEEWKCEHVRIQAEIKADERIYSISEVSKGVAKRIQAESPETSWRMTELIPMWFAVQKKREESIQ